MKPAPDGVAICVLGSSRAGTSLTARLLNLAGVYLGAREELLGGEARQLAGEGEAVRAKAKRSNPEGHWEHYRLMRFNEWILRRLGGNWREPPSPPPRWELSEGLAAERAEAQALLAESFDGRSLWGWKDPRNSLTLPFWRRLLPSMRCVICVRNPVDVARSLQRRDGLPLARGVELWLAYLAAALVNTSGTPRLLVRYEDYFEDPAGTAARLIRFAGCEDALSSPDAERRLTEAIDARMWRNRAGSVSPTGFGSPSAATLFRMIEPLTKAVDEDRDPADRLTASSSADAYAEDLLRHRQASAAPGT